MGTKISLKIAVLLFLLAFLAACGNSKQLETEKKSLQTENEALKARVQQLTDENSKFKTDLDGVKAELEDLKQTDQYLFSKAKEQLASSNDKDAKALLDKLLTRFPNSTYKAQATGLLKDLNSKIAIAEAIENGESKINSAVSSQEFSKAWTTLRSIKKYISGDKYNELAKAIDEEQNKPISVSVIDLISDKAKYSHVKVKIEGYMYQNWTSSEKFILVDDHRKGEPYVFVGYDRYGAEVKKRLLSIDPRSGDNIVSVTVIGVFDGDNAIQAIEVNL